MAGITLNRDERKELITALVTNCAGWDADDVELLVNMGNDKLYSHAENCYQLTANEEEDSGLPDTLNPSSTQELESSATDEGWDEEEPEDGDQGESVASTVQKTDDQPVKKKDEEESGEGNVTENQWLQFAPPRIRSVVINAMNFEHTKKQQLVETITANRRNRFSDSYLMTKGVEELEAMADLAGVRQQQNFIGAAGGPVFNESSIDRDDILTIPVLEFKRG